MAIFTFTIFYSSVYMFIHFGIYEKSQYQYKPYEDINPYNLNYVLEILMNKQVICEQPRDNKKKKIRGNLGYVSLPSSQ